MLLSFRVSNYRSLRDEQEFSFVRTRRPSTMHEATPGTIQEDGDIAAWHSNIGTVAGVFGANASGKSNLIKALQFMRRAVLYSHQNWQSSDIPINPFRLDSASSERPSLFEVVFFINRTRYQYGFSVTEAEIVSEWLYAYRTNRRQVWFERDAKSKDPYYFGKSFTGRNRIIAELTRPNSLFLSSAQAHNHKMVRLVYHWFDAHLRSLSPEDRPQRVAYTKSMSTNPKRWTEIVSLMQFADMGICEARVRKDAIADAERNRVIRFIRAASDANVREGTDDERMLRAIDEAASIVEFGHSTGDNREPVYFSLDDESLGTQAWFSLVGPVLRAINNGDTLMVDELDASLHPQLTSEVLKIFWDPERNPKQAQILFTTHDTALLGRLMGDGELSRDQVWFTQKKRDGSSNLYPLTDFAPRKEENLERGYLQGRYGAVPYLEEKVLDRISISPDVDSHRDASNKALHEEDRGEESDS